MSANQKPRPHQRVSLRRPLLERTPRGFTVIDGRQMADPIGWAPGPASLVVVPVPPEVRRSSLDLEADWS